MPGEIRCGCALKVVRSHLYHMLNDRLPYCKGTPTYIGTISQFIQDHRPLQNPATYQLLIHGCHKVLVVCHIRQSPGSGALPRFRWYANVDMAVARHTR